MYLCICKAVPEAAVRGLAVDGLWVEEVGRITGAGTICGRCADVVAAVVAESKRCDRTGGACTGCRGHGAPHDEAHQRSAARSDSEGWSA